MTKLPIIKSKLWHLPENISPAQKVNSKDGKTWLAILLAHVCTAQRSYGSSSIESLVDAFVEFFPNKTIVETEAAIKRHMIDSPHVPTIHDMDLAYHKVTTEDPDNAWLRVQNV